MRSYLLRRKNKSRKTTMMRMLIPATRPGGKRVHGNGYTSITGADPGFLKGGGHILGLQAQKGAQVQFWAQC